MIEKRQSTRKGSGRKPPPIGTRWKKGQSGNPGGQPKGLLRLIREETEDGAKLVNFMLAVFDGEHGAKLADRMAAATWLADRGFGRPVQAMEVTGAGGAPLLPLENARAIVDASRT